MIARIILQNPAILILDEATSALDNESERFVMTNLTNHFKGRTILMIAHRLRTIQNADLIVVMNNGLIIESGTHASLMEQRQLYYHLSIQQLSTA